MLSFPQTFLGWCEVAALSAFIGFFWSIGAGLAGRIYIRAFGP